MRPVADVEIPDEAVASAPSKWGPDAPLVTIVTPSLNHGRFIRRTVESVLSQDYPNIQYIVVDGGSTDETLEVLRQYGAMLDWRSEVDRGQADALNKGFRRARGEILTWLNSDDWYEPGAISRAVQAFQSHPEAVLVHGSLNYVDPDEKLIETFAYPHPTLWKYFFLNNFIAQPAAFFSRSGFERVGELDASLRYAMDHDLFFRLACVGELVQLPDVLANMSHHDETITMSGGLARFSELARLVSRHTGVHRSPATAMWAIDCLDHSMGRSLRRRLQPAAAAWSTTLVHRLRERVTAGIVRRANDVWDDDWSGRCARFVVRPEADSMLVIEGIVPSFLGEGQTQRLEISVNGVVLDNLLAPEGPFRAMYRPIPPPAIFKHASTGPMDAAHRYLWCVTVRADSGATPPPPSDAGTIDRRQLAWRADRVASTRLEEAVLPVATGWFSDGWASPTTTLFLPSWRACRIVGSIPVGFADELEDQQVTFELCGQDVAVVSLEQDAFEATVELSAMSAPIMLRLRSRRWFVPCSGADRRRLAYRLDSVTELS